MGGLGVRAQPVSVRAGGLLVVAALAACSARTREPVANSARGVGFRVTTEVDSSRRTAAAPAGRAMPVGIWYPTTVPAPGTMRYESYVGAGAVAGFRSFLAGAGIPDSGIAAILAHPMRAVSGAAPRRDRAPLVLLAPGNGNTIADVAFLGEMLAAHGYLAVAVPSPTRLGDSLAGEADVGRLARVQANDLAFALRTVRALPGFRVGEVAVVGHSFGARAALLMALGTPMVKAVVSLDGGIGTATGLESMHEAIGSSPLLIELGAPLLHIYERRDAWMAPDFRLLRATQMRPDAAPIAIAEAKEMRHVHFTSIGNLADAVPALAERTGAPAGLAADIARVRATVLWFLDRELRGRGGDAPGDGLSVVAFSAVPRDSAHPSPDPSP